MKQILGVLGYQRAFIKNYAHLACPLHNLLKKREKFKWTDECKRSLDTLIGQIATDSVLTAPDESHPFELETDASFYAVGAALFQKDARGKWKAIGYASKTLNSAERNYDIWDREFLGLIFGLTYWRHLLCGTRLLDQVFIDHANLLHYRHPQKVNRRVVCYILTLANYNIKIHHRLGPLNRADALFQRPDYDEGKEDNNEVTPLPPSLFAEQLQTTILDALIEADHKKNQGEYSKLQGTHHWEEEARLWK